MSQHLNLRPNSHFMIKNRKHFLHVTTRRSLYCEAFFINKKKNEKMFATRTRICNRNMKHRSPQIGLKSWE